MIVDDTVNGYSIAAITNSGRIVVNVDNPEHIRVFSGIYNNRKWDVRGSAPTRVLERINDHLHRIATPLPLTNLHKYACYK